MPFLKYKRLPVVIVPNWTERSIHVIQGVIAQEISKSDGREVRGRFEITSAITP